MIGQSTNGGNTDTGYDNIMKKVMISFFAISALLYIFFEVLFINNNNYISTVEIFSVLVKFTAFLAVIAAYKLSKNPDLIYLEIVFGTISMINIIFLFAIIKIGNVSTDVLYICYFIHDIMDYITYVSAIVLSKKSFKFLTEKFLRISYFVYSIVPLAIIISIICLYRFSYDSGILDFKDIFCGDQFIFLGLLIISLSILYQNSDKLSRMGSYKSLVIVNILFLVAHIFSIEYIPYFNLLYRLSYFIRLFAMIIVCYLVVKLTFDKFSKDLVNAIKHKEYAISDMKDSFRNILDFMPYGVIVRDENDIVYANNVMVKLSKAASMKSLKEVSVIKLVASEYEQKIKEYSKDIYDGKCVSKIQEEIVCFNGERVLVEVSCLKINMDSKDMVLSFVHDISYKREVEEREKQLLKAKEREKVRGEFFANISHELRTPINVIYSALQVMQMHVTNEHIENVKIKNYMKVIRQNCYRLLRIISNLIDITKIDAGFLKPNLSKMEIVSLIENISMSIVTYLHQKGMELVFDTNVEEKYIECDADMVERVMLNLFSNAVKFGKKDGHVWVNIHDTKKGNIIIEVKDDGIGIAKNKQSLIFKRFAQVDNCLIRRSQGSGIGLSLVKSIVDMNGGKIKFESKENVGTKFIMEFPTIRNEIMGGYGEVKTIKDSDISNTSEKVKIEFADIMI